MQIRMMLNRNGTIRELRWLCQFVACVLVLTFCNLALADDTIVLNSGEVLHGQIVSDTETNVSILVANATKTITSTKIIAKSEVKSFLRETPEARAEHSALAALGSFQLYPNQELTLTRYVQGISAFQEFLKKHPNSSVVHSMEAQIATWQAEQNNVASGLVKFGNEWMTPAEKQPKVELFQAASTVLALRRKVENLVALRAQLVRNIALDKAQAASFRAIAQENSKRSNATPAENKLLQSEIDRDNNSAAELDAQAAQRESELRSLDEKIRAAKTELAAAETKYASLPKPPPTAGRLQPTNSQTTNSESRSPESVSMSCESLIWIGLAKDQDKYLSELASFANSVQAKGDLEAVLAVRAEQDRFQRAKQLDQTNLVQTVTELRTIQERYLALFKKLKLEAVQGYIKQLEEQKRKLTMDGRLNDAVAVKTQIESTRLKYNLGTETTTSSTSPK